MIPMKNAFLRMPVVATFILFMGAGYIIGGIRSAIVVGSFTLFIALTEWWDRALITMYMATFGVIVSGILGIIIGTLSAQSKTSTKITLAVCDTLQTFPSFIYLLPAIMLFQISDVSAIFAIVIYSSIPMVRYTVFGLRNVPQQIIEASITSGCTDRQLLWKVKMPLAFPEIILGANQTLMFSLFMVMIAGFIGTVDLSQEIFRALSFSDGGKGLIIGLCVAFIGLTADRLLVELSLIHI